MKNAEKQNGGNMEDTMIFDKGAEMKTEGVTKDADRKPKDALVTKTERDTIRVQFEGDAAKHLIEIEAALKTRNPKGDLGRLLGAEVLAIPKARVDELIEEQTPAEYYLSVIQNHGDKDAILKILKSAARRLTPTDEKTEERPKRKIKLQVNDSCRTVVSGGGIG